MFVKKRNGSLQAWDTGRIHRSLVMAFNGAGMNVNVSPLVREISDWVLRANLDTIGVEKINEIIESVLMDSEHYDVARRYIEYRALRTKYRNRRLKPDTGMISDYIHASKYARQDRVAKRLETWEQTVERSVRMHVNKFPKYEKEIRRAFDLVHAKQVLPSMRCIQFAGEAIKTHNERMYNCSFTHIGREDVFGKIFFLLLCGCGVGYSVQWQHVRRLPRIGRMGREVVHFTVPDSIEGWGGAVNALITGAVQGQHIEFDYSRIRSEGSPLVISGGYAPGHLGLKAALECCRAILLEAQGRQLRPIECHDMICHLAEAVLSGGIRRSSLISLFSEDDTEMMYAKAAGVFDPVSGKNKQRMLANNSCVIHRTCAARPVFDRIMELSQDFGEPGFLFVNDLNHGCNPCGEIGLDPRSGFSFCNLTEINMATATDYLDAACAASIIGTLQATYTDFQCPVSRKVAETDALLGVSMTGMMDRMPNKDLQRDMVEVVRETNIEWSKRLGIRQAARLTCVKPSGTASLLLGCVGSGIHPHHARRYFRRVTANINEDCAKLMMIRNPHMVEKKPNGDICIVFPVEVGPDAVIQRDMYGVKFLEVVKDVFENWVLPGTNRGDLTHNVSCTVATDPSGIGDAAEYVWRYRNKFAGISFVPMDLDKKYPFAPREEVTSEADETRWNNIIANYRKVDYSSAACGDIGAACEGAKCII